jgi:hypothetical protein
MSFSLNLNNPNINAGNNNARKYNAMSRDNNRKYAIKSKRSTEMLEPW